MTNRERFRRALEFQKIDRMPKFEMATWWNKTIDRWETEGLPKGMNVQELNNFFGHDRNHQFWVQTRAVSCPAPAYNGAGIITDEASYAKIKKYLYCKENMDAVRSQLRRLKADHDKGDAVVWLTLEGYFWYPRTLFGIEGHLFAFYDYPELMKQINRDHLEFSLWILDEFCKILTPDFMTLAEDMSYNKGPMLSKAQFDEFLKPYYLEIVPALKSRGIIPFIDTDGLVEPLIPWFAEVGLDAFLPLERQSQVDANRIHAQYPNVRMIGAFDKRTMHMGEEAMRAEFERLLPVMRSGGFILSVDHQTPPDVSLEQYWIYMRLLDEYAIKAAQ